MALAVVLLIGAALMIRSFIAIRKVNPGFDAHHVLTMRMSLTGPQFNNPAHVAQVIHEGVRRIRDFRVSKLRQPAVACRWIAGCK